MNNKKRIIFLGNPIPEYLVKTTKVHNINTADNIAQNVVVKGLYNKYHEDLMVISVSSDKNIKEIDLGYGPKATMVTSCSLNPTLYYLSIMISYTRKLNEILRKDSNRKTIIITNGPYIYMALPVIINRLRHNVKWIAFLIGSVEVPEAKFPFSLVSRLSRWTSKKVNGTITYVTRSVTDYMPEKPFVEIFYIIDDKIMNVYKKRQPKKNTKFTIAYTGSFTDVYNIDTIVDLIQNTGKKYRWLFAGTGKHAHKIDKLSNNPDYNVRYFGKVSNVKAIEIQRSSHLLLCLRGGQVSEIDEYYNKYASSGKLTEYLCSGTPILAGDIPAFSSAMKPYMTCEKVLTVDRLIKQVLNIEADYGSKLAKSHQGKLFAFKNFTSEHENEKIYKFIETF